MNKTYGSFIALILCVTLTSGCAVVTALRQPEQKNLQVLNAGTSKENVAMYLGAPISSETKDGKTIAVYQFPQGYSGANKATRATIHVTMDILTLFLWELIAWPAEIIFNGKRMTVKVNYDENNRVEDVVYLRED